MWPTIDGLEERFKGVKAVPRNKWQESSTRLSSAPTKSSAARRDFQRILLYPERTILMNNTERIVNYQKSGAMSRQLDLQRREKWFN